MINTGAASPLTTHRPWHRRLAPKSRVRLDASACLPVRYPGHSCDRCVASCPVEALTIQEGAPALRGDCIGCGQCSASCPTSALQTDGFVTSPPPPPPAGPAKILVDCWRVPRSETKRGTVHVPCLGGITPGSLLELFDRGGERPIRLLDRGGCATCPAGAGLALAKAAVAETRMLLTECGVPAEALPKLVTRHDRITFAPAIPSCADAQSMGRRGFFRDLVAGAARTLQQEDETEASDPSFRQPISPVERMRVVTALARIAARYGRTVPTRALPRVSLAPCAAHGVCAGVCPTGALRRPMEADGATDLRFLAALCIGCGECTRACPEQAIRVAPSGGSVAVEILAHWTVTECEACGRPFTGAAGGLCRQCAKEADVMRGMAALFQPSM